MVLFALYLAILDFDNGTTSKIDDVLTEHGGLPYVLPLAVHLDLEHLSNTQGYLGLLSEPCTPTLLSSHENQNTLQSKTKSTVEIVDNLPDLWSQGCQKLPKNLVNLRASRDVNQLQDRES